MKELAEPIFIHSLFRSGSTYIFNAFRRSSSGYTAYQEPLHEVLIYAAEAPEKLFDYDHHTAQLLRHPALDKPYFYEFYSRADIVGRYFRKEFSYDKFFLSDKADISDLKAYFLALIAASPGIPVFQCCRSTGRVRLCRRECGGRHIFLWRNAWDQWWSYKLGFDSHNLLIVNSINSPNFLKKLKSDLGLPEVHLPDTFAEFEYYNSHALTARQSYMIFYSLWCHAMLEALPFCDLSINIDSLSARQEYRENTLMQLRDLGIDGLDFSDCQMPRSYYGSQDKEFFQSIEEEIHRLLQVAGYSRNQIEEMLFFRAEHYPAVTDPDESQKMILHSLTRARELVNRYETILPDLKKGKHLLDTVWAEKEQIKLQLEAVLTEVETHQDVRKELDSVRHELNQTLHELETARIAKMKLQNDLDSIQKLLDQTNMELAFARSEFDRASRVLQEVLNSKTVRWTAPVRAMGRMVRSLLRSPKQIARQTVLAMKNIAKRVPLMGALALTIKRRFPSQYRSLMQRLTIYTAAPDSNQVLQISDTGLAQAEEHFVKLFRREMEQRKRKMGQ